LNKKILILIDSHDRNRFFKRFTAGFTECGMEPITITSLPTVHIKLKLEGINSILCKKEKIIRTNTRFHLEKASGEESDKHCRKIYSSFHTATEKTLQTHEIHSCIIWNGSRSQSRAVADACKKNSIPTIFLEITNIPGKLFADPLGVNSESLLYKDPTTLKKGLKITNHQEWRENYIKEGLTSHKVKQSKRTKRINYAYSIDLILTTVGIGINSSSYTSIVKSLIKKITQKKRRENTGKEKKPYIFLPLQLTNDSQVLLHSDICNRKAIDYAVDYSKRHNLNLIVKKHPADHERNLDKKLSELSSENTIIISTENTFKLIRGSVQVITINSSVALESKIIGRDVKILGKSIYEKVDNENLKYLLHSHFINIDYFSNENIRNPEIIELLNRGLNHQPP